MALRYFLAFAALIMSSPASAEDMTSLFGLVPGQEVPNIIEGFSDSQLSVYERPLLKGPLSEYFQHIEVTVLPPRTVAVVSALRAYKNSLDCMKARGELEGVLEGVFPVVRDEHLGLRATENGDIRLSLSCSTSGSVPYYSLEVNARHQPSLEALRGSL